MALDIPLRKTAVVQKNISFLRPKIWSKISNDLKVVKTTNCFTHGLKKEILDNMIMLRIKINIYVNIHFLFCYLTCHFYLLVSALVFCY